MNRLLALPCLLLLGGCAANPPHASPLVVPPVTVATATAPDSGQTTIAKPQETPATKVPVARADDNLNAVAWTQTAIEHDLIYREVYQDAQDVLLKALADPGWDALPHNERKTALHGLPPAVVLDIDETVLDNSPYEARLTRDGETYNSTSWAAWVREQAAKAMPGALAFTRYAAAHHIAVIYISNRDTSLNNATLANLRAQGFPVSGPEAFLGKGTKVQACSQRSASEKTCRRQLIGQHYRVLVQVGDQLGDFLGVPENTVKGRRATVKPYLSWFGQRWFMLPNPTYGDWQSALFNNDWSLPAAQRRQQTLDALRYH